MISKMNIILFMYLINFCNSYNVKKPSCIYCKMNILKPNKREFICRRSDCLYGKKQFQEIKSEQEIKTEQEQEINSYQEQEIKSDQEQEIKSDQEQEINSDQEQEINSEIKSEIENILESDIETIIDSEIKNGCENYDNLIERLKMYKKAKIRKFIKKIYQTVNKQLDKYI